MKVRAIKSATAHILNDIARVKNHHESSIFVKTK